MTDEPAIAATVDLGGIVAESVPADTSVGKTSVADESAYLDNKRKHAELHGLQQDIEERKRYANKLFCLIAAWLFLVLGTVWASAAVIECPRWWPIYFPTVTSFKLSDAVLLALIGATTANVLGLFIIVAKYLFPDGKR